MSEKLTYHREGDYLIPDLISPDSSNIGIWGERRRTYLKKHKDGIYTGLLLSGELNNHLEEVDRTASEMAEILIAETAKREGITEHLKAENQIEWVRRMNAVRFAAEEIVLHDLIYC